MGNFISRCFGVVADKKRKNYLRTDYEVEKDFSIEFQNLMDEEPSSSESSRLVLTDREKQLLKNRQFDAIIHEQKQADDEIEAKLAAQEQQIEEEEEAFYEAKREAARISKLNKEKEKASKQRNQNEGWANEDEWEVAGVEDDFENFLANVKARSQATLSQVKNGSGDAGSQSQTTEVKSDNPPQIQVSVSDITKEKTTGQLSPNSNATSDDEFEWDSGFVSAEDNDRKQLVEAANS